MSSEYSEYGEVTDAGDDVALVQLELNVASNGLLGGGDERAHCLTQGRVPLAVVNQIGKLESQLLLVVLGLLVEGDLLELLVSRVQNGTARGLINASGLHADQSVLDDVQDAAAVLAAELVEGLDEGNRIHFLAVYCGRNALFKVDGDVSRNVGSLLGRNAELEKTGLVDGSFVCRIFEVEAFVGQMPQVLVLGVVGLAC